MRGLAHLRRACSMELQVTRNQRTSYSMTWHFSISHINGNCTGGSTEGEIRVCWRFQKGHIYLVGPVAVWSHLLSEFLSALRVGAHLTCSVFVAGINLLTTETNGGSDGRMAGGVGPPLVTFHSRTRGVVPWRGRWDRSKTFPCS